MFSSLGPTARKLVKVCGVLYTFAKTKAHVEKKGQVDKASDLTFK